MNDELISEKAGTWYIRKSGENEIRIKTSAIILKAILQGCDFKLIFGKQKIESGTILLKGCIIFDSSIAPMSISGIVKTAEEHAAICTILDAAQGCISLVDELGVSIAFRECTLNRRECQAALELLREDIPECAHGKKSLIQKSLDVFDKILKEAVQSGQWNSQIIKSISISENKWKVHEHCYYTGLESFGGQITDKEEGAYAEKLISFCMDRIFPKSVYRTPHITKRELIDILAVYELGIFLIESKVTSMLSADYNRPIERKIENQKKHIFKAFNQLKGAVRKIRNGDKIYDCFNSEITINRELIPHCIVLVSEIYPLDVYRDVVEHLLALSKELSAMVHIMDMEELATIMKAACCDESKKQERFDYILMMRFQKCAENRSIHIKYDALYNKIQES